MIYVLYALVTEYKKAGISVGSCGTWSLLLLVCLAKTFLEVSDLLLAINIVRQFDTKNIGLMGIYFAKNHRNQYQIIARPKRGHLL